MRVAVVIPARNEEDALPRVLGAIPKDLVEEVIVVDNASADGTAAAASAFGATLLEEPRRGYGSACLAGVEYLRARRPDVVVFLDADWSDHPEEMPLLLAPIERGESDLVVGSRVRGRRVRRGRGARTGSKGSCRTFAGGTTREAGPSRPSLSRIVRCGPARCVTGSG